MNSQVHTGIIREIVPLSNRDCFYIADRQKTEFTYPLHTHSDFELNFIENAKGVRRIVGDSVEIIGDYELVLITGEELEHVWEQHECKSKEIREITIQFSHNLLSGNFIDKTQFDSVRRMLDKAQNGLSFSMKAIMNVYPILDILAKEQEGFYSVINFLTILYRLSLAQDSKELSSSSYAKIEISSESRRVKKVQDYINQHYKEDIKLADLANMAGMTPTAFSRFFKLRTGKSLSDYIIDIRLGISTRMLTSTTHSIAEICYDAGFNNLSNFNRIFRKKKGCTPREFRENFRRTRILI